ncbi:uncharacterized protein [Nicotiana tomentosiformis]|uniref:uncharacterized protein n=1 Tax=Nicotiana tomentosiformis TaxID=4098 RepID=UPI00388C5840
MGIVDSSGVSFTAFQLRGAAYQWWRAYELDSPAEATSLTWTEFSDMFLREYVPQSLRDAWRAELEQLRRSSMTVSEYVVQFSDLARHAPALGRGYRNRPVYSALPAASGTPTIPRPQDPYYAPPVSNVRPIWGASSGHSSRSCLSQSQQTSPPRACFECGDTRHMVRDWPRFRRGAPSQISQARLIPQGPQISQVMITAPVATPPAQPARGGGRTGRGQTRGEGQARYYALPARTEAVASYSVITCIVPVCHRDAYVLFDPGSTYSYVSSYFAPCLGASHNSLSSFVYVSTPVGDSIIVDRVYRSFLIAISYFETIADLLLLNMVDFDIILGMDWLSPYHAILDCYTKTVMLAMPDLLRLEWRGTLDYVPSRVLSFLKAQRIIEKGCDTYLAYVRDVSVDTPTV